MVVAFGIGRNTRSAGTQGELARCQIDRGRSGIDTHEGDRDSPRRVGPIDGM